MDALRNFTIPFQGLKLGVHQFEFQIDSSFFEKFENSAIDRSAITLHLEFDRRINMIVLDFKISGTIVTDCDRCMEEIDLPITGEYPLMVKFSEDEREDTDEVIYINPKDTSINIARYAYEFIHLSVPIRRLKPECEETPEECETNVLVIYDEEERPEDENDEPDDINPIWSELDKLRKK